MNAALGNSSVIAKINKKSGIVRIVRHYCQALLGNVLGTVRCLFSLRQFMALK